MQRKWSSGRMFLFAAVGSAVGLANIWRFPYVVGANGGGAFVLIYVASMLLIVIPLLIAEVALGRRGGADPISTMTTLARESGASPRWRAFGWLAILTTLIILSFYSVIAGWALAYVPKMLMGLTQSGVEHIQAEYAGLTSDPIQMSLWHGVFMVITIIVIARGLHRGIESAVKVLMPALFLILLGLVGYAGFKGDFSAALAFLFRPDFSKLSFEVVLMAVGSAFFSASVGVGAMMTYGAYLPQSVSIWSVAAWTAVIDLVVALCAGLATFPIVFANDLSPDGGPGLVFVTLPLAFSQMQGGFVVGLLFFTLLFAASLTSAFSLLEPAVLWLRTKFQVRRARASWAVGLLVWVAGLASVFSFNIWKDVHLFSGISRFQSSTIFDLLDVLVTNVLLPLGALMIAVFAGWQLSTGMLRQELVPGKATSLFAVWQILIRYLVPIALAAIFVGSLL